MPLYEYRCDACGRTFEIIQKFSDALAEKCPSCGRGPVHKLFSSPAIQFKGSGWYITDYAKKDQQSAKTDSGSQESSDKKDDKKDDKKGDKRDDKTTSTSTTDTKSSSGSSSGS